jgi:bifunctional non-homologous end joining protein LigD
VPLDDYHRKRDFTKSPEPAGDLKLAAERAKGAKAGEQRFFCVQKHLASHLHYDFRLEHNGVLLSWAVPKGPSLDPKTKRLAMHVEDHPIEYGTFEGVIPEGYGAGIVMLWDVGTWTPETADVDAALKKGDLKFTLDGYKLKGSWVLVRTGGYGAPRGGGGRSWLLIKHRDDWAGDVDITDFAPRSVKSDGDFEDILAADQPDVWISHKPAPARGGEAGEMLAKIIEKAAALKASSDTAQPRRSEGKAGAPRAQERPRPARAAGLPTEAPARLRQGSGGQPSPERSAKVGRKPAKPAGEREAPGGGAPGALKKKTATAAKKPTSKRTAAKKRAK